jgi:signal transduction histidine kinase/CheY-like chemotaxis protein
VQRAVADDVDSPSAPAGGATGTASECDNLPLRQLTALAARALGARVAYAVFSDDTARRLGNAEALAPVGGSAAALLCERILATGVAVYVTDTSARGVSDVIGRGGATAFAGVPIRAADGTAAGALCVVDRAPRKWTSDDTALLEDLAGCAATEIELRLAGAGPAASATLVHAQKMESLGVLAGGVSHDFNNLLTAILGFAGMLKRSPNVDRDDRESIESIEQAARRGADITGRLLAFSRGGLARFTAVDLADVITETLELVAPTVPASLAIEVDLTSEPVTVEGDRGQLLQALLNIVLNARDALAGAGTIRIGLRVEEDVASLTVADDGPGMDEQTRLRIFEPFFTTKPAGSGTGLGMAITYGIVQGHHGKVAVESTPGGGTTFRITLPLATGVPAGDSRVVGDGNLILLVDDDAMVRRATGAMLADLGYNVVEAGTGEQAARILAARPGRFAAVLLDLVMPGMNGGETFRAMTAVRQELPVVVITGYAADSHIDGEMKRQIAGLLQKPFSPHQLAEMLRMVGAEPHRTQD